MNAKPKPCLISCSVLKNELKALVRNGALDVTLSFYDMHLHSDYDALEKNLRRQIQERLARSNGKVIVVNGDYCLGQNNEMKKLADEYGVAKVEALNCIDCLFGGKGKYLEVDPAQECLFLSLGWIKYFHRIKSSIEGTANEEVFRNMFNGLRGIVLLDTVGELNSFEKEIKEVQSFTGLPILERRNIGLENLKRVILEAAEK